MQHDGRWDDDPRADLRVLVVDEELSAEVHPIAAARTPFATLLGRAVAAPGGPIAAVLGEQAMIERMRSLLGEHASVPTGGADVVVRAVAQSARAAAGKGGELAVLLERRRLLGAFVDGGHGPVVDAFAVRDERICLLARPSVTLRFDEPDWSGDEVVEREQARGAMLSGSLGVRVLQHLATECHRWAMLPVTACPSDAAFTGLGFVFHEPLAQDRLFRPAQIPAGWLLARHAEGVNHLAILDGDGRQRAIVTYDAWPSDRWAGMLLLAEAAAR
jgi:hypothetical protein